MQNSKCISFPCSAAYGCESWSIRKAERRGIDSFELWCWRRTNKSVLEEIKASNPLEALIKKKQLSYFGHIKRRENSLEKSIMLGMGDGTRKKGRPRARWLDYIKAVTNCTLTEPCTFCLKLRCTFRSFSIVQFCLHNIQGIRNVPPI